MRFYVGPAVIIPYKETKNKTTIYTCPNDCCGQHGVRVGIAFKFCGICGSKHQEVEMPYNSRFTLYEFAERNNLIDVLQLDITEHTENAPSINIMNQRNLGLFFDNERWIELTEELKVEFMRKAENHPDVKRFLNTLNQENIEYKFIFIAISYYQ